MLGNRAGHTSQQMLTACPWRGLTPPPTVSTSSGVNHLGIRLGAHLQWYKQYKTPNKTKGNDKYLLIFTGT